MAELDFGNIFNKNGDILQLRYAQKRADNGSTTIAMKNASGAVLIASKSRVSNLLVQESDQRIRRLASNAYMAFSGLLSDGLLISNLVKKALRSYSSNYGQNASFEYIKKIIFDHVYLFTSKIRLRVIGANFLTICQDNDEYQVLSTDPSGKVTRWKACAIGNGQRRALTELEKLDLENMSLEDLTDQGIKILYKCFDPLNDPQFDIEVVTVSSANNKEFVRVESTEIEKIVNKYKDISMDDSE